MDTLSRSRRLAEIRDDLQPGRVRERAIADLDALFRTGSAPEPAPEGFLPGQLVTMSVTRGTDAFVRSVSRMYMPWLGKSFDPGASTGVNVLKANARAPMKVLWPSYSPLSESTNRLEVFPFKTRIAAGAVDPDVEVLKIDYDFEANPRFLIRKILDELVQIDDRLYLGKILYRWGTGFRPIGFFSLENR